MKRLLKPCLLAAALLLPSARAALTNLGTLTITKGLTWDNNPVNDAVIGYNLYAGSTNLTNFTRIATVATNRYPGGQSTNVNGWKAVYLTAVNDNGESAPSVTNLVHFLAGVPTSPVRMQFYSILTAAATDALPLAPLPPPLPPSP